MPQMTDLVQVHPHSFQDADWPFDVPVNTAAFSSAQVLRHNAPSLVDYHDHDGEWQFVHGDVTDQDECLVICLGCAYQRAPDIAELASLPLGWRAERRSVGSPWEKAPYEARDGVA
jgi:hypothetical protein